MHRFSFSLCGCGAIKLFTPHCVALEWVAFLVWLVFWIAGLSVGRGDCSTQSIMDAMLGRVGVSVGACCRTCSVKSWNSCRSVIMLVNLRQPHFVAGGEGFEPSTPNLGGWCSLRENIESSREQPR